VAHWLASSGRRAAWLTLDRDDDDPRRLGTRLLTAVELLADDRRDGVAAVAAGDGQPPALGVVARLVAAIERAGDPVALVLDDYHAIADERCHDIVRGLLDDAPATLAVVIATRATPPLRLARRRIAETASVVEVDVLRFRHDEATALLARDLGRPPEDAEVRQVVAQTDGWAAGVVLAASVLADAEASAGASRETARLRDDVQRHLLEEALDGVPADLRRFLRRTSPLSHLGPALCDAVTGDGDGAARLDELRRLDRFLVAGVEDGGWLRLRDASRDALLAELRRTEPELERRAHDRAAAWLADAGMVEDALEHAGAAGDGRRVAELLRRAWPALIDERRFAVLRRHADRADPDDPLAAALRIACSLVEGADPRACLRDAEALVARAGDDPVVAAACDLVVASPLHGELGRAIEAGSAAVRRSAREPRLNAAFTATLGSALMHDGRVDEARALLEPGLSLAEAVVPAACTRVLLAWIAVEDDDLERAVSYVREADALIESSGARAAPELAPATAIAAHVLGAAGRHDEARERIDRALAAEEARPGSVGHVVALRTAAGIAVATGDLDRARRQIQEARRAVGAYPAMAAEAARIAAVEAEIERVADSPRGSPISAAELRVLELLDSDLSLTEIGARLYLSRNTVKSHVRRLYRRLGVTNRADAVAIARDALLRS